MGLRAKPEDQPNFKYRASTRRFNWTPARPPKSKHALTTFGQHPANGQQGPARFQTADATQ
eukprot:15432022-Alexandrium_andersonii.AAC.1